MMPRIPQRGFTIIEAVVVIVITGIIAGIVAVFLKTPIQQYMDVRRRAEMTDTADTAMRRISRDLRIALPNSVRVVGACGIGTSTCRIEFIPTTGGGRYRVAEDAAGGGNALDFSRTNSQFDIIGTVPTLVANDQIVIYNLGIAGADAYPRTGFPDGDNRATVSGTATTSGVTTVNLSPAFQFSFDSPGHRFHVVTTPVSYICSANAATPSLGTVTRVSGYGWTYGASAGTSSRLASNVSNCVFTYNNATTVVSQRTGLVTMRLSITEDKIGGGTETVNLYHAVHINNQP